MDELTKAAENQEKELESDFKRLAEEKRLCELKLDQEMGKNTKLLQENTERELLLRAKREEVQAVAGFQEERRKVQVEHDSNRLGSDVRGACKIVNGSVHGDMKTRPEEPGPEARFHPASFESCRRGSLGLGAQVAQLKSEREKLVKMQEALKKKIETVEEHRRGAEVDRSEIKAELKNLSLETEQKQREVHSGCLVLRRPSSGFCSLLLG